MVEAAAIEALKQRFLAVSPFLDERTRRLMLAGEALALLTKGGGPADVVDALANLGHHLLDTIEL